MYIKNGRTYIFNLPSILGLTRLRKKDFTKNLYRFKDSHVIIRPNNILPRNKLAILAIEESTLIGEIIEVAFEEEEIKIRVKNSKLPENVWLFLDNNLSMIIYKETKTKKTFAPKYIYYNEEYV